jgi:hypothetical protein
MSQALGIYFMEFSDVVTHRLVALHEQVQMLHHLPRVANLYRRMRTPPQHTQDSKAYQLVRLVAEKTAHLQLQTLTLQLR